MYKKKACIESLSNEDSGISPNKAARNDTDLSDSPSTIIASDNEDIVPETETQSFGLDTHSRTKSDNKWLSYINSRILSSAVQTQLQEHYRSNSDFHDDESGVKLCHAPFRHCVLPNFIPSEQFVDSLESALADITLTDKNNDLYKFSQSQDLSHHKSSSLSSFKSVCEGFRGLLKTITNIPLNSKIDLFCSKYKYTDVLLCHDDELEERRIAFIYYLVPESWSECDGGTLDLFDAGDLGEPKSIVKSIVPKRNTFLFFEVSALSLHQVAEVLSESETRLSISGWFHGPALHRPPPIVESLPRAIPYGSIEEDVFYAWFNPLYLAPDVQADVRKRFEEDSEIELTDFLQEEKYTALLEAIKESRIEWQLKGPPNKRRYHAADVDQLPPVVAEFVKILQSDAAFLVLSNLTGLRLHPMAPVDDEEEGGSSVGGGNPRCRSEVRRWEHGSYTLSHDTDPDMHDFALDTIMYVGCAEDWSFENGGYTSYIAKGEDDELLSVCPASNSLGLVYRDRETMRFVKHLNHRVSRLDPKNFYEINTVYYE